MIIDASILIESLSDNSVAQSYAEQDVSAPDLIVPESLHSLWKVQRVGVSVPDIADVFAALDHITIEPSRPLAARAWKLATELDHPIYDCLYLALAERNDDVLVTRDARLYRKATGKKITRRLKLM